MAEVTSLKIKLTTAERERHELEEQLKTAHVSKMLVATFETMTRKMCFKSGRYIFGRYCFISLTCR